jgi:hypothetical protein
LSAGGAGANLRDGVFCFKAAFFIALMADFSAGARGVVGRSSGANATKTGVGEWGAPAAITPSKMMREGISHICDGSDKQVVRGPITAENDAGWDGAPRRLLAVGVSGGVSVVQRRPMAGTMRLYG